MNDLISNHTNSILYIFPRIFLVLEIPRLNVIIINYLPTVRTLMNIPSINWKICIVWCWTDNTAKMSLYKYKPGKKIEIKGGNVGETLNVIEFFYLGYEINIFYQLWNVAYHKVYHSANLPSVDCNLLEVILGLALGLHCLSKSENIIHRVIPNINHLNSSRCNIFSFFQLMIWMWKHPFFFHEER